MSGALGRSASVAALSALLALGLTRGGARRPIDRPARTGFTSAVGGGRLVGQHTSFAVELATGRLTARALDAQDGAPLDLSLIVDGSPRPLTLARFEPRPAKDGLSSDFAVDFDDGRADVRLVVLLEPSDDALVLRLEVKEPAKLGAHTLALGVDFAASGRPLFVSGKGEIADGVDTRGRFVVVDEEPEPLGFASRRGALGVQVRTAFTTHEPAAAPLAEADAGTTPSGLQPTLHAPVDDQPPLHVALRSAPVSRTEVAASDLVVLVGRSTQSIWGAMARHAGVRIGSVRGRVTGTAERARVYGLDAEGAPVIRATADVDGRFDIDTPKNVTQWYAALDATQTSAPVLFDVGTPYELRLDVSRGGELRARVIDPDTGAPLTARLMVHGIDGTLDPSFGPDFRASGAGPLIDALRGEVTTPLPVGRYRVAATKGIEWSVDDKVVEITSGRTVSVELAPRHVVPTPGVVGCDLHVHARPSFDTPVSVEDRVLSLVAAGVDFAVPTEHNLVGDYAPALQNLDLGHDLASVPGVEVTTFSPRLGHFGVFPYPLDAHVPPYKHTSVRAIFNAARHGDPNRVLVVHHPRLTNGIGYFELMHVHPTTGSVGRMRTDFDALEVYNGYEMASQQRVDLVLRDYYALLNMGFRYAATGSSDSHRIQYQWAGYPRTLVAAGPTADGPPGALDVDAVVAAVKHGHATVSTGPIIELTARAPDAPGMTAHPGDELSTGVQELTAHLRVRVAPWIDLTSVEVVSGGRVVRTFPLPSRPAKLGPELGTLAEAQARTLRFDEDVVLPLAPGNTWFLVIARGTRRLDDVLPFMPIAPMGITNPVWIVRPPR